MVRLWRILWLLPLLALPARADWHYQRGEAMGTEITVYLWHDDPAQAELAALEVLAEMRRIDQWLSPWISSSELARVNAQAGQQPVSISPELLALLQQSLHYSALTGGAFDISFASVGYRYDYRAGQQPDSAAIAELLPAVNYRLIELDAAAGTVHFGDPRVRLDLGGIAKGYAVDRAIDLLRARGVAQAQVSAGGDSRLLGDKRGRPWIVGVRNPRDEKSLALKLPLTDTSLSTSGDYERYFLDANGERIHHILNPGTGRPVTGIMSVTVMGPLGQDTDPLSTSLFVLGVDKGLALIESLPGFEAILIDAAGQVHFSTGLAPPGN